MIHFMAPVNNLKLIAFDHSVTGGVSLVRKSDHLDIIIIGNDTGTNHPWALCSSEELLNISYNSSSLGKQFVFNSYLCWR